MISGIGAPWRESSKTAPAVAAELRDGPVEEVPGLGVALVALEAAHGLVGLPARRGTVLVASRPAGVERRARVAAGADRPALDVHADAAREGLAGVDELADRDALEARR